MIAIRKKFVVKLMLNYASRFRGQHFTRIVAFAATAVIFNCQTAFAQQSGAGEPDDVAGTRVQPDYDAAGISLGSILLKPTLAIAPDFNSNIFAEETDAERDISVSITPALTASLNKPGQNISLYGEVKARRYLKFEGQNDEQYRVEARAFQELPSNISVSTNIGFAETTAARGTFENDLQVGDPLRQRDFRTSAGVTKWFNRLKVDGTFSASRFEFSDVDLGGGIAVDQSFRNGSRVGGTFGLGYEVSPLLTFQIRGGYDEYDYNEVRSLFDRDAKSYLGTVGVRYEITRLLIAQFDAGLREYKFKNPAFADIRGLSLSGRLRWYPTPLISVKMDLNQSTTTSAFDSVSAVTVTDFKLSADYEYRRNIILTGQAQAALEEYGGIGANAKRYSLTARATWKLNRRLAVSGFAGLNGRTLSGSPLIPSYTAAQTGVSFRLAI